MKPFLDYTKPGRKKELARLNVLLSRKNSPHVENKRSEKKARWESFSTMLIYCIDFINCMEQQPVALTLSAAVLRYTGLLLRSRTQWQQSTLDLFTEPSVILWGFEAKKPQMHSMFPEVEKFDHHSVSLRSGLLGSDNLQVYKYSVLFFFFCILQPDAGNYQPG